MTQDSVERMMRVSTRLTSLPRRIAFVGGTREPGQVDWWRYAETPQESQKNA